MEVDHHNCAQTKIKWLLRQELRQGVSLNELSQKLGYSSPSGLSMILNNKRAVPGDLVFKACKELKVPLADRLNLLEDGETKVQVRLIDNPFSGEERKEFFRFLNGDSKNEGNSNLKLAFFRVKEMIDAGSPTSYQDSMNFPYYFQVNIAPEKIQEFQEELSDLIKILVSKYTVTDSSSAKLTEGTFKFMLT